MVVTHDCLLDKGANHRYAKLRAQKPPIGKATVIKMVEEDPQLDRFVVVAPIIPVGFLRADASALMRGEVLGYFPIEPWPERGIIPGVVDLTFPATVDRNLLVTRPASLTDDARGRLRLALARTYAFRTPESGFEIESAIGRRIQGVTRVAGSPMEIDLELQGGGTVRMLVQPQPVSKALPSRRAPTGA